MSETTIAPKPRIIVELQPDGSIVIESYQDGARSRESVMRGFEMHCIAEELYRQKTLIQNAAERKRLAQEREENSRHRKVWYGVAENHGIGFANRTVGKVSRTPKEPAAPVHYATIDLL